MKFVKRHTIKFLTLFLFAGLLFSVIGCTPEVDNSIPVTGITMQSAGAATTITTHAGTLLLSATLAPANSTNKLVTWSVTNGTGSATITQSGVLTAVTNGLVTAKVTSQSTPTLSAQLVITISNQVTDNRAPLADAIAEANLDADETMVGTSAAQFTPSIEWVLASDMSAYLAAIAAAQVVLDQTTVTQAQIDDAIDDLDDATQTFDDAKQNGTKVLLAIHLGDAEDYAILAKAGVSTTGTSSVVGNIGVSPAAASYITGFGLTMDSGTEFSTSSIVTGQIFAADYLGGTPAALTTATNDMLTAYNDGAGRTADYTQLYAGDLSGQTFVSGVYMWSNNVLINTDFTIHGASTDVFIFQIAGSLTMAANTQVILTGGVLAENIFWVVADTVAIGVGADFQGVVLSMSNISLNTGSTITGMLYAQTDVSLNAAVVTKP